MQQETQTLSYVQLPQLLKLFEGAPQFIADKPYKAVELSENGQLMVEAQITEHMAASLPTVAKEVTKGQMALINARQFEAIRPSLSKKNSISPQILLDQHIEVMDVLHPEELHKNAFLAGTPGDIETNYYLDPIVEVTFAPEEMSIPSFMEPVGVEPIRTGQILVKTPVLGILPYQRPYKSLTQDATFLEYHLPVVENQVCGFDEATEAHQAFAIALKQQTAQNQTQQKNFG